MRTYKYRNNNFQPPTLVLECTDGILEADEIYKKAVGKDPAKQPYIGCEIIETLKGG